MPDPVNVQPVVTDPKSNKAILAAVMAIAIVVKSLIQDHDFDWSEEGLTSLIGAIGVLFVWLQSNYKRLLHLG